VFFCKYFLQRGKENNWTADPFKEAELSINEKEQLIDISTHSRGGSRIVTVELQHPLLPLDIIDNI
jgi:hypothetical protein